MNIPAIDLRELKKLKEDNFKERLDFVGKYANWVRKTSNKKWSSAQRSIIDR